MHDPTTDRTEWPLDEPSLTISRGPRESEPLRHALKTLDRELALARQRPDLDGSPSLVLAIAELNHSANALDDRVADSSARKVGQPWQWDSLRRRAAELRLLSDRLAHHRRWGPESPELGELEPELRRARRAIAACDEELREMLLESEWTDLGCGD